MSSNPTGLSPSTINATLRIWLDGSDSSTVQLSGATVTQWDDKSGMGYNFTYNTYAGATVAPSYQNGKNVLNFTGYNLYCSPSFSGFYPLDCYMVVALKNISRYDIISINTNSSEDNFNSLTIGEYQAARWHNGSSGFFRTPDTVSPTDETSTSFLLMQWSLANNNFILRRNGTLLSQTASYTFSMSSGSIFQIGWRQSPYYQPPDVTLEAYIAEICIYSSQLNTTDRQYVEGYLAWKWGIQTSLPDGHPFRGSPAYTTRETVPRSVPSNAMILPVNTLSTIKTFNLPVASTNIGRILMFKDSLGYAGGNNIFLSTIGLDRIESTSVSSMILSNAYGAWTFTNDGLRTWFLTNTYRNTFYLQAPYAYPAGVLVLLQASSYSGSGTWFDLGPGANDATLENGTIAKNAAGNGIVLNGSTNWIFRDIAAGNNWTLSVWYKNTGPPVGPYPCIVTQIYTGSYINICFGFASVQGFSFHVPPWNDGVPITITNTTWTYYTGTWDGTTLSTYINGVLQGTTTPGGTAGTAGSSYRIGRRWDDVDYMVGEIGEVRIYNQSIAADKVAIDYNYTRGTYGV